MPKKIIVKGNLIEIQKIGSKIYQMIEEGKVEYLDIGSDEKKEKGRITVVFKHKSFSEQLDLPKSKDIKIGRFFHAEKMETVKLFSNEGHKDRKEFFGQINYGVNNLDKDVHSLIFTSGKNGENITAIVAKQKL